MPGIGSLVQGGGGQGGSGQPAGIGGNEAAELPDLANLESDASGSGPGARPSHTAGDMSRLSGEIKQGMQDGSISEQAGSKALSDIGSGNVSGVEQDLGASSSNSGAATAGMEAASKMAAADPAAVKMG